MAFNHSTIQPFNHSTIQPFKLSFNHSSIQSSNQAIKQSSNQAIKQRYPIFITIYPFTKDRLKIPYFLLFPLLLTLLFPLALTHTAIFLKNLIP
ncbi:hypothetical protein EDA74_07825 [Helicobacter pylori]|nr:hypothetical protein [Helicobacter pylori]RVZ88903.1 hypothetical protein EDA74_07825 [Helicobacter pylori]